MDSKRIPRVGDDVFYRLPLGGRSEGQARPAKIVRVWTEDDPNSSVQLQVFTDGSNDGLDNIHWATSVVQGTSYGQFHYRDDAGNIIGPRTHNKVEVFNDLGGVLQEV